MKTAEVRIDKNIIIVDRNLLSDFFGKNKNTISGWKNSKDMPVYSTEDGTHFYNLIEIIPWVQKNINERFNPNKDKTINTDDELEFDLKLPYDLQLADIDTNNSLHLNILAAHPMGQLIRETLDFKVKYEKQHFELRVKKKEFLKTEELNARMTEFIALVKDSDINTRTKIPIEIAEKLLAQGLIKKEDKETIQSEIAESIDNIQTEKYKIISKQFMKHIISKTKKITLEFLEEIKTYIQKEENNEEE